MVGVRAGAWVWAVLGVSGLWGPGPGWSWELGSPTEVRIGVMESSGDLVVGSFVVGRALAALQRSGHLPSDLTFRSRLLPAPVEVGRVGAGLNVEGVDADGVRAGVGPVRLGGPDRAGQGGRHPRLPVHVGYPLSPVPTCSEQHRLRVRVRVRMRRALALIGLEAAGLLFNGWNFPIISNMARGYAIADKVRAALSKFTIGYFH